MLNNSAQKFRLGHEEIMNLYSLVLKRWNEGKSWLTKNLSVSKFKNDINAIFKDFSEKWGGVPSEFDASWLLLSIHFILDIPDLWQAASGPRIIITTTNK